MFRYVRKGKNLLKECMKNSTNSLIAEVYTEGVKLKVPYHYTPMQKVTEDVMNWCQHMCSDFDTVVAIPRSGLIVGSMIATTFGKALSTPDLIVDDKKWMSKHSRINDADINFYKTIFLVDDGLGTGNQMRESERLIREHLPEIKIIKGVVYCCKETLSEVDRYYKKNLVHSCRSMGF